MAITIDLSRGWDIKEIEKLADNLPISENDRQRMKNAAFKKTLEPIPFCFRHTGEFQKAVKQVSKIHLSAK